MCWLVLAHSPPVWLVSKILSGFVVCCSGRQNMSDWYFLILWSCTQNLQVISMCYYIPDLQRMHTTRSPSSISTGVSGDALDLSLSGSQLSMSKRPSSASPGKYFSRSVSVSVASDSRGKRNTLVSNHALPHVCFCSGKGTWTGNCLWVIRWSVQDVEKDRMNQTI